MDSLDFFNKNPAFFKWFQLNYGSDLAGGIAYLKSCMFTPGDSIVWDLLMEVGGDRDYNLETLTRAAQLAVRLGGEHG